MYFLQLKGVEEKYINILRKKIIVEIETLYYINDINKRMLLDYGIYDKDIDKILRTIGRNYDNLRDMILLLHEKWNEYKDNISFM